jgi:folate-binding protein YgfZ
MSIIDQSKWGRLRVTGADRVRFLQGMLTNDVNALAVGGWCRAAVLNVKGRVLAVVDAVKEEDAFVLVTEPVTADKLRQILERYAISDDVTFTPIDVPLHRVWSDDDVEAPWTAPPIFAAPPSQAAAENEIEVRRVEAGLPKYGVDVSEDYFPFEANLDRAISHNKGCYVGQEVVARATARGHANKRLVGIVLAQGVATPGESIGAPGAAKESVGVITSSALSPRFGAIALGYVHKSAWEPGTQITLIGDRTGTVRSLPFSRA